MHFIVILNWMYVMHQHCIHITGKKKQKKQQLSCYYVAKRELKGQPTSEQLFLFSQKALVFSQSFVLVSPQGAILWC